MQSVHAIRRFNPCTPLHTSSSICLRGRPWRFPRLVDDLFNLALRPVVAHTEHGGVRFPLLFDNLVVCGAGGQRTAFDLPLNVAWDVSFRELDAATTGVKFRVLVTSI